jgi:hypothetical protein
VWNHECPRTGDFNFDPKLKNVPLVSFSKKWRKFELDPILIDGRIFGANTVFELN